MAAPLRYTALAYIPISEARGFTPISGKETLQEGRQEGERSLVLRQLSRRLGQLSPEVISRVETLALPKLEELGEALLDFSSSDDLMTWLQSNC